MSTPDAKADLSCYLQLARDALLWKLEGLSEYDVRRPFTPTGTNLLGLVKHATALELGYLGATFGRPTDQPLPWVEETAEPDSDLWATAEESRQHVVDQYRRAWAHADATIELLPLDTVGRVPWWPAGDDEATLHHIALRVVADTQRHAGHADLIRELLDGAVGMARDNPNMNPLDAAARREHWERLEQIARAALSDGR